MTETTEHIAPQEGTKLLPDKVTRQLLVVSGRKGLTLEDLNESVLNNQRQFSVDPDDYAGIVQSHQNIDQTDQILGVHEEVRKSCSVIIDGKDIVFVEETPRIKNVWVGEYAKLLTEAKAAEAPYGGRTALDWALQSVSANEPKPEMVVKARDGYFYPATVNDVVISTPIK